MEYKIEHFTYHGGELLNNRTCPHCSQKINLSRLIMGKKFARELMNLYHGGQEKYQHYEKWKVGASNNYSKLKYWGLIDEQPNNDPKRTGSGHWRLTYSGVQFVQGEITIPKSIFIYNDTVVEIEGNTARISFAEAYGEPARAFDIRDTRTR